jgi:hypothetical protein
VLRRFLDKDSINFLFPKFARDARDIEYKLALLENIKVAYM